ncbi:hypothetical protein DT076_11250 [Desertihabitans brevis]|uniref:Uncharacterized protein n=1 Tax=Desertihabitans brevis TaxID=2268447 RepID=A0A367YV87_9ACTN|nr:hypothetical protein [Desertihabitans brevis]RCK69449.1 hypothetical protein DT076_11250 [Desertihabitans brevis]
MSNSGSTDQPGDTGDEGTEAGGTEMGLPDPDGSWGGEGGLPSASPGLQVDEDDLDPGQPGFSGSGGYGTSDPDRENEGEPQD